MEQCDTLLMVGSSFPYSEFLPKEGQARGVQIDIDSRRLGLRYPMDVNLVGDSRLTLQALLPLLQRKADRSWRDSIEAGVGKWWQALEARAMTDALPLNPQRVFWELSPLLPEDCIVTCDSGTSAAWYARDLKLRRGMMGSVSGSLASMGCGLPYALAAKFAHPRRPVVALIGDGAMQMLGINALVSIAHRWRDWVDPRMAILVLNNGDLNMVSWEQRANAGERRFDDSQLLPAFPYAEYAKLLGLRGIRVDKPELVKLAWEEAFSADRPVVLEMVVDANVPPVPPHVSNKQIKNYVKALMSGDPEALEVVKATAREWWAAVRK
jgi:pyruvate dehydrogenase (quinone)